MSSTKQKYLQEKQKKQEKKQYQEFRKNRQNKKFVFQEKTEYN